MSSTSATWQHILAAEAFDDSAWEFKSRQLASSSEALYRVAVEATDAPTFESVSALPSAQLLLALAIELMAKAYFLKSGGTPKENIYSHEVRDRVSHMLSAEQLELLEFSQNFVVWAGRYPTPKMNNLKQLASADVPSRFVDGIEHFESKDFPNHVSPDRYLELGGLFNHLRACWATA
ncbi:hypothetical protein [Lysobacter sp. HA35]